VAGFIVIMGLVAVTQVIRTQYAQARIRTIYNQFYVIKDIAFKNSYFNAMQWLLSAGMVKERFPSAAGASAANLSELLESAWQLLDALDAPSHEMTSFFTHEATKTALTSFRTKNNCPLITNPLVACNDPASRAVFSQGLFYYRSFATTVFEMLETELTTAEKRPASFASLTSISQRLFFTLQSLVFPATHLTQVLLSMLTSELTKNLDGFGTFLASLFGVEVGIAIACILIFWQFK